MDDCVHPNPIRKRLNVEVGFHKAVKASLVKILELIDLAKKIKAMLRPLRSWL